ncbi:MAG: 3-isopropylmalate dehydratase small subunit [Acidobacteria bacterium]|nr:3-isopropylmalate dehydratase small subunit [Acidobacteriota bacterium]
MEPVITITGTAVPLDRSDVDTDQIIPSDWLKRVERTGFGQGLFSEWREDPEFVLNLPQYRGACILLAGPNFGVGSSREHAVWSIMDYGFAAVIAPRFGDIFRNNSTKNGLVPVVLPAEVCETLLRGVEADATVEITIDVRTRRVQCPALGVDVEFPLDDATQERFLNGLDDIGITLQHEADITAFEATRPSWMPTSR